jgi:hypothetical protein
VPEHPSDDQLREWDASTKGHERAAAIVARWAQGRQKWENVPPARELRIDAPSATITRALNMLVELGVLIRDRNDYFVGVDPDHQAQGEEAP